MTDRIITKYCKSVSNRLVCTNKTRTRLIDGLKAEIEDKKGPAKITNRWLNRKIGSPQDVAELLQEGVSVDETETVRKRKKIYSFAIITVFLAVLWLIARKKTGDDNI